MTVPILTLSRDGNLLVRQVLKVVHQQHNLVIIAQFIQCRLQTLLVDT